LPQEGLDLRELKDQRTPFKYLLILIHLSPDMLFSLNARMRTSQWICTVPELIEVKCLLCDKSLATESIPLSFGGPPR